MNDLANGNHTVAGDEDTVDYGASDCRTAVLRLTSCSMESISVSVRLTRVRGEGRIQSDDPRTVTSKSCPSAHPSSRMCFGGIAICHR